MNLQEIAETWNFKQSRNVVYPVDITAMMSIGYTGFPADPPVVLLQVSVDPVDITAMLSTGDTTGCRPGRL